MSNCNHFPFLTSERILAFKSGVQSYNEDSRLILRDRQHLLSHTNSWHQAMGQRPWVVAHISEALSYDENIIMCHVNNMWGIQFDRIHFARLFKIPNLIDTSYVSKMPPFPEPKAFSKARNQRSQLSLFPSDVEGIRVISPLSDLNLINIGYYMLKGRVVELYFVDQDASCVRAIHPLGLLDVTHDVLDTIPAQPQLDFELKYSSDTKEAE